jgi:hypothetical protein
MEVIPAINITTNSTIPNKFNVLLGGSIIRCYNDTNCNGNAVCGMNQPWQAIPSVGFPKSPTLPGMCICPTNRGIGVTSTCDQLCERGVMMVCVMFFALTCGFLNSMISGVSLAQLFKYKGSRTFRTPVQFTMIFAHIGSIFIFVACILQLITAVGFGSFYHIEYGPGPLGMRELKRIPKSYDYAFAVVLGIGQVVGLSSRLFLTMSFVDLTERSLKIKKSHAQAIYGVALSLTIVSFCILFPFYVLAANAADQGDTSNSLAFVNNINITWSFIQANLILLNGIAFVKCIQVIRFRQQLLSQATAQDGGGGAGQEPTTLIKEDKLTQLIKRMMAVAICMIIFSIVQIVNNQYQTARFLRTMYSEPTCVQIGNDPNMSNLSFQMSLLISEMTLSVCIWFVFPSAVHKIREAKSIAARSTNPGISSVQIAGGDGNRPYTGGTAHTSVANSNSSPQSRIVAVKVDDA